MPRSRLGPLALESKLGAHPSLSSVWSAVHVEQRIRLAVKVFSLPLGGTLESRKELAREWDLIKRLSHPTIAKCYGGGFEETDAYLAFELVEGETLADQVERRGRLPWETVLDYADEMVAALVHAHDQQIIHSGLEPDKIMIEPLGSVRVIDYRIDRFNSPYHTNHSPSLLHFACRSPELIVSSQSASIKSDLYAVGAILYFGLTGRPPISGETPEEVAQNAGSEVPSKINAQVLECPIWFAAVIEQLLEKDPNSRPFSAQAAQLALVEVRRKAASGSGVAEHATSGFSPLPMKADKKEARQALGYKEEKEVVDDGQSFYERAWFLLLSLAVLLGIVTWFMIPPSEEKLRTSAEALLASDNKTDHRIAKDQYLEPLIRRFPDGEHRDWALDQIDEIEMMEAEYQLQLKMKHGRTIRNEAERLYAQAREFEQFGDMVSALDQYRSMVTLLDENEKKARPYINLARRQIQEIESGSTGSSERTQLIQARLAEADALSVQGRSIEARKIWYSIVELYGDNQEMKSQVDRAQDRLNGAQTTTELTVQSDE